MPRATQLLVIAGALLLLLLLSIVANAAIPAGFFAEQIMNLDNSNCLMGTVFTAGSIALVAEKSGVIYVVDTQLRYSPNTPPRAMMRFDNIDSKDERGLIAIVLDPNFAKTGYFYVYYTPANPTNARLSRFTANAPLSANITANISSELVLWQDVSVYSYCCHFGGGLDFGPDGALYLTIGDQGMKRKTFSVLDRPELSAGVIIRVFPNGTVPSDNFGLAYDGPAGVPDAIWAYGLRNPFRASWDLPTRRLFVAEVGGNIQTTAHEDLHLGRAGANYGWPLCEGDCNNPDFPSCTCSRHDSPIFTVAHNGSNKCIIGGFVYRSQGANRFPASYTGAYFYGEFGD